MGKGRRRDTRNGNNSSIFFFCLPCKRCEHEICKLREKDLYSLNEKVLLEKIELESQLNESKERNRELLANLEYDKHLRDSEKQNLLDNVAELQTKILNMATERGLLCQNNRTLLPEVEFLKAQLAENITKVAEMQDERVQNDRVLQQYRTENIDLKSNLNDSKGKTQDLLRKIEEDKLLWDAKNSNLESTVAELRAKHELMASEMISLKQKNKEVTVDVELVKYQVNALESELNESKKRSLEFLQRSEADRHLWDDKKSNLEGTVAELQTKHDDLMLQLARKKEVEEELLATMSSLEEMKESTLKGEIEIANLRSQLLAVAEEKDGQIFDIQRQFSAMAEEKKKQLVTLQDQLSSIADGKKMVEEENKSLRTELDRRKFVAEEEEVRLKCRVRELQTTFTSLHKRLDSSRAIAREKMRRFVNSQNRHSEFEEAKTCLENKNDSQLTELKRCTMGSNENKCLQNRGRELETEVESFKKKSELNDNYFQNLMAERQGTYRKAVVPIVTENGTPKQNGALKENPKTKLCPPRKWRIKERA